jgi:UDPglucose--hexose-1-phosphate uridylyltransferase
MLTQLQTQPSLEKTHRSFGLSASLEQLYKWSFESGYLTQGKLEDNIRYDFYDVEFEIIFKTQINIARSQYSPKPPSGVNTPKLHCPICFENIGISGKETLRAYEFDLSKNRRFFIQLTPFPLHPKHFVLIDKTPTPMIMNQQSAQDLVNFIDQSPGYIGCSNSDVEWAGASILSHHHYQVFDNLHLPIMEAKLISKFTKEAYIADNKVKYGLLHFPIATCYLECKHAKTFIQTCGDIIAKWKAEIPGKNTCNLIIRKDSVTEFYQAYIIFRNPDFRTPTHLTHIKSEGVGIIEVAGEGIYPIPQEKVIWDEIQHNGLDIIKSIITGNNPVKREDFKQLFEVINL